MSLGPVDTSFRERTSYSSSLVSPEVAQALAAELTETPAQAPVETPSTPAPVSDNTTFSREATETDEGGNNDFLSALASGFDDQWGNNAVESGLSKTFNGTWGDTALERGLSSLGEGISNTFNDKWGDTALERGISSLGKSISEALGGKSKTGASETGKPGAADAAKGPSDKGADKGASAGDKGDKGGKE